MITDNLKKQLKLWHKIEDLCSAPGLPSNITIIMKDGNALYQGEQIDAFKSLEELAFTLLVDYTRASTHYEDADYLTPYRAGNEEDIVKMTQEDYYSDFELINMFTLAKKYARETCLPINKDKSYFISYSFDSGYISHEVFENDEEVDAYIEENFGDE